MKVILFHKFYYLIPLCPTPGYLLVLASRLIIMPQELLKDRPGAGSSHMRACLVAWGLMGIRDLIPFNPLLTEQALSGV
jgi:hypothetical protein